MRGGGAVVGCGMDGALWSAGDPSTSSGGAGVAGGGRTQGAESRNGDVTSYLDATLAAGYVDDVRRLREQSADLRLRVAEFTRRLAEELDVFEHDTGEHAAEVRKLRKEVAGERDAAVRAKDEARAAVLVKLEGRLEGLYRLTQSAELRCLMPPQRDRMLSLYLGKMTPREVLPERRYEMKASYQAFFDHAAAIFIAWPLALLAARRVVAEWRVGWSPEVVNAVSAAYSCVAILYGGWLLYFYTALAIRESVLRANGSNIRGWWIAHHYISIAMTLVSLMWPEGHMLPFSRDVPDGASDAPDVVADVVVTQIMHFVVAQGIVMMLQNRYQRSRLYTRIALGKAGSMDVVGEGANFSGQLKLLIPLLFALQAWQFRLSYVQLDAARRAFVEGHREWQLAAGGFIFFILAVGNFRATLLTVLIKAKFVRRKRAESELLSKAPRHGTDHALEHVKSADEVSWRGIALKED